MINYGIPVHMQKFAGGCCPAPALQVCFQSVEETGIVFFVIFLQPVDRFQQKAISKEVRRGVKAFGDDQREEALLKIIKGNALRCFVLLCFSVVYAIFDRTARLFQCRSCVPEILKRIAYACCAGIIIENPSQGIGDGLCVCIFSLTIVKNDDSPVIGDDIGKGQFPEDGGGQIIQRDVKIIVKGDQIKPVFLLKGDRRVRGAGDRLVHALIFPSSRSRIYCWEAAKDAG